MNKIKLYPEQLRQSSKKINMYASRLKTILKNVDRTVGDITYSWNGVAFSSFQKEFSIVRPKMNVLTNSTYTISNSLKIAADIMEAQDKGLASSILTSSLFAASIIQNAYSSNSFLNTDTGQFGKATIGQGSSATSTNSNSSPFGKEVKNGGFTAMAFYAETSSPYLYAGKFQLSTKQNLKNKEIENKKTKDFFGVSLGSGEVGAIKEQGDYKYTAWEAKALTANAED